MSIDNITISHMMITWTRWQNWYEWLPGLNFGFLIGGQHFNQHKLVQACLISCISIDFRAFDISFLK